MEDITPKGKWKKQHREFRTHKKKTQEEQYKNELNELNEFNLTLDAALVKLSKRVTNFIAQTILWFIFAPLSILCLKYLTPHNTIISSFMFISFTGCVYSFLKINSYVRTNPLTTTMNYGVFSYPPLRTHFSISLLGAILALTCLILLYYSWFWAAFFISLLNIPVFLLLILFTSLLDGMVSNNHLTTKEDFS